MAPVKPRLDLFGKNQFIDNETIVSFTSYTWFFGMIFAMIFAMFASFTIWGRISNGLSMLCAIISISSIVVNVATQIENKIMRRL